jgi:UDP-2,3-diacylglucosamine pyrophosphatase LpxH
MHILRCI